MLWQAYIERLFLQVFAGAASEALMWPENRLQFLAHLALARMGGLQASSSDATVPTTLSFNDAGPNEGLQILAWPALTYADSRPQDFTSYTAAPRTSRTWSWIDAGRLAPIDHIFFKGRGLAVGKV